MPFKPLKKGDTIAFFSPSSPGTVTAPKRFKRAKTFLESKGFNLSPGNLTGKKDGYRSGNAKQRANELNELISNPNVDCIISTIGGINSNSLIPYIDYNAFKQNPKIIIGHSDVTSILLALYAKTGITTFYGPALIHSFGEFSPFLDMTWAYFEDMLLKNYSLPYTYTMPDYWTDDFMNWEEKTKDKARNTNKWLTINKGQAAYSGESVHPFRSIPSTCSRAFRPVFWNRSTLILPYVSDFLFLVKFFVFLRSKIQFLSCVSNCFLTKLLTNHRFVDIICPFTWRIGQR